MRTIEVEIVQALHDETGKEVSATDSLDSLGIDSLRMAQLATQLERRFDFRVDEELLDVGTVKELADYVRSRVHGSPDDAP